MSTIIKWWAVACTFFLLVYWFAVRGREINWVGFFQALPGIIADLACQAWLDVTAPFKRSKKSVEIELDEYERELS